MTLKYKKTKYLAKVSMGSVFKTLQSDCRAHVLNYYQTQYYVIPKVSYYT